MRCNAQATQAISEILIQVQIQLVHVSVGCAVTGEDQLRKLDCAEVERCGAARDAVIKNVPSMTNQDPLTRRARREGLVHGAKSVSCVRMAKQPSTRSGETSETHPENSFPIDILHALISNEDILRCGWAGSPCPETRSSPHTHLQRMPRGPGP